MMPNALQEMYKNSADGWFMLAEESLYRAKVHAKKGDHHAASKEIEVAISNLNETLLYLKKLAKESRR